MRSKEKKSNERVSLNPLEFDEALTDLLQVKPDESERNRRTKKQAENDKKE